MTNKWKNILLTVDCPSTEDLILYAQDKISGEKRMRIENHLLDCNVCTDVVEGYLTLENNDSIIKAEKEIALRLKNELFNDKNKTRVIFTYRNIAAAASICLIIGLSGWYFLHKKHQNNIIALTEKQTQVPIKISADTITISKNEPQHIAEISKHKRETDINEKKENFTVVSCEGEVIFEPEVPIEDTKSIANVMPPDATVKSMDLDRKLINISKYKKTFKVTGKIKDSLNGEGLVGVNVVLKGSSLAAVTDVNGNFEIAVPDSQAVIVATYIGYRSEEIKVNREQDALIAMVQDKAQLEEIVVVGFGAQKKADFSRNNWIAIAMQSLESDDKKHSLEALNSLRKISDSNTQKSVDNIIKLVKDKKFAEALIELKKLK